MKSIKENYELEEVFESDLSSRFDDEAPIINEDVKIKKDEFEIIPDHEASLQMLNHDLGSIGEDIDSSDDIWESKEFDFNQPDEDITEGTSFDGTPGFMSPEEIRNHEKEQADKLKAEKERISAEKKAKRKEALRAAAKAKKKRELAREVESKSYYVLADILNDVAGATEDGHDAYDLSEDEVLQTLRSIMSDEEILKKYHELFESLREGYNRLSKKFDNIEDARKFAKFLDPDLKPMIDQFDHENDDGSVSNWYEVYYWDPVDYHEDELDEDYRGLTTYKGYIINNHSGNHQEDNYDILLKGGGYIPFGDSLDKCKAYIDRCIENNTEQGEENFIDSFVKVSDIGKLDESNKPQWPKEIGREYDYPDEDDDEPRILPPNADDDDYDDKFDESLNDDTPEEKAIWEVDLIEFKDNDLEDYDVVDTVQVTYSDLNNRFNDLATKNIRTKEVADNILLNSDIGQAIGSIARDKANVKDRKTDIGFGFDNLKVIENHLPSGVDKLRKELGRKLLPSRLSEKIVKIGDKYQVQSRKGKNMGTYDTKKEAEKRLKDVEMFKHMNESTGDRYVYSVGVDLSDDDSLILLGEDIAELDDYNLVLYGVSDNGDGTGEMFFAGSLRNIGRYLDNYIGGIQINTDYLVPEDAFEGTVSSDYLKDHPFDLDKISLGEEYRESLINLDIDKSLNEEVIEYDHGTGFVFPNVYDTLQVYCQWEGLLGYEDDIIDYQDTTEEDLDSYLRDEDIYGYTHSLWEILQGKEAYCSDMDINDFNNVCADLFLDPKDAEVYNSEEVKSVDESVKPDYYELEYTFGKDHYNGEEFTYKVDKFDAVEYLLKDNDLEYLADKLGCEEDEDVVAEKLADHLDLFERDLTDHFSDDAYDAWKDRSGFDESLNKEEVKEDFNIGSNKNVEVGSEPYNRIKEVCDKLNDMDLVDKWNNKDVHFTIEEVYEDYGANMLWKTIICNDESGSSEHQILNPREWMDIANGVVSSDEAIKNIMADEYCQFKLKEQVKEDVSVGQSYYLKFDSKEEADKAEEIIKSRGLLPDRMSDKLMKVIGNEAGDDATKAILDELGLSYEFK